MTKLEIRSAENSVNLLIEQETQRVIADHLPTIYSVKQTLSKDIKTYKFYSPEEVETHIREFFAAIDEAIETCGRQRRAKKKTVQTLQLFLRRLYTVASIESHIRAAEQGLKAALAIAGGREELILQRHGEGQSGRLFIRTLHLLTTGDLSANSFPRVILFVDDVAHSGYQMWTNVHLIRDAYPTLPVVVSVGTITDRALTNIRLGLSGNDQLLFQEKKPCIETMVSEIQSPALRQELTALAAEFFTQRMSNSDFDTTGRLSTHITTPFKLPDETSNGRLASIFSDRLNKRVYFNLRPVDSQRDRYYPNVL